METLRQDMAEQARRDREFVEGVDGVCYLNQSDIDRRLREIPSVSPGQGKSHPLEGNPVYEWCREGGGYDRATMPWRLFNDILGPHLPGSVIPPACDVPAR